MDSNPPLIEMKEYLLLLEKLVAEGQGFAKPGNIVAILADDQQHYFVTRDIQQGLDFLKTGRPLNAGTKGFALHEKDIIDEDYEPADPANPDNGHLKPNPGSYRVVLRIEEAASVPTQWEISTGHAVEPGGYIMIKQSEVAGLAEALEDIRQGRKTPAEALYTFAGPTGRTVMKFDVVPLEPFTLNAQGYAPVELNGETKSIAAKFAERAAAEKAFKTLPFTRRGSEFVGDHTAPERAAFKKRTRTIAPD